MARSGKHTTDRAPAVKSWSMSRWRQRCSVLGNLWRIRSVRWHPWTRVVSTVGELRQYAMIPKNGYNAFYIEYRLLRLDTMVSTQKKQELVCHPRGSKKQKVVTNPRLWGSGPPICQEAKTYLLFSSRMKLPRLSAIEPLTFKSTLRPASSMALAVASPKQPKRMSP